MRGSVLYPLNALRDRHPDIYERERAKFAGREGVLTYRVPHLGVAWGDTVNLSTLDPRLLVAERRRLGVPFSRLLERRLVRIPTDRLAKFPAVRYESTAHWINSRPGGDAPLEPPASDFSPFDPATYVETQVVPPAHVAYLAEQLAAGELALGFVFVPHVLAAGPIDLKGLAFESL
jgi:hypothetical protein